jgi:hypothetical protein
MDPVHNAQHNNTKYDRQHKLNPVNECRSFVMLGVAILIVLRNAVIPSGAFLLLC